MFRRVLAIILLVGCASATLAQNVDVIAHRQEIYKGFGKVTKPVGGMLKGDVPFDLAVVKAALTAYVEGGRTLPALFPDDSKMGHQTQALPVIWDRKADFNGRLATFAASSEAALTAVTDKASFSAAMPKILGQCGGCHKEYRAKEG